jgi:hypothetical protein
LVPVRRRRVKGAAMRVVFALSASLLLLAGCESVPADTGQLVEEPRERCDTVLTGSRIPQCNRGDVKVMTREEMERAGLLSNPAASTGELLPGKSH